MSIRDLFDKNIPTSIVTSRDLAELGKDVESAANITQKIRQKTRFIPQKDYGDPKNFAHFGSAVQYYNDAFSRIANQYPYDGSLSEQTKFINDSTFLDLYIFDKLYPRRTGYVKIAPSGFGVSGGSTAFSGTSIGLPVSLEYIQAIGGPHTASSGMIGQPLEKTFAHSNIYDTAQDRESNLKCDMESGVTIEFWMKKSSLFNSLTETEIEVPAMLSNGVSGSVMVLIDTTTPGDDTRNRISIKATSGSAYVGSWNTGLTNVQILDNKWHHYAFTFKNTATTLTAQAFYDGAPYSSGTAAPAPMGEVTGALKLNIGSARALRWDAGGLDLTIPADGYGKLTGSIDEFRYWKTARTAEDIGRYWFTQYGGGTNTDLANTSLGVYYKFNEGITGITATDSTTLDYSGRISNGTWVGYTSGARSTGSAIDTYLGRQSEFRDPIIYTDHPAVISLQNSLIGSASAYDLQNNSSIYRSLPSWIVDEDGNSGQELLKLTQILSSYLDTLYLQIENYPRLKDIQYPGPDSKPIPFAHKLLEGYGLATSEMFVDATILEQISNRNEEAKFDEDLSDIKNLIYKNIYNNLVYIYKSKGNIKAFRNVMRCYGIDTDLVKINLYGDNTTYRLRDNYETLSTRKKYIDFNHPSRYGGTLYQQDLGLGSAARSYITGSRTTQEIYTAFTLEGEAIFTTPQPVKQADYFATPFITSSLFGFHGVSPVAPSNLAFPGSDDFVNVYAVREAAESPNVKFCFVYGVAGITLGTVMSPLFYDVYNNQKWNLALRFKSAKEGGNLVSGSTIGNNYVLELYGANAEAGQISQQFTITASLPAGLGVNRYKYLSEPKRIYAGAHRQDFVGAILQSTDIKLGSVRYWTKYLEDGEINSHARDPQNFGSLAPYQSTYLYPTSLTGTHIPQIETLALNWEFDTITGSNASGRFKVLDLSSGSATKQDKYRWMGDIVGTNHPASASFFPANSSKVLDTRFIYTAQQTLPENIQGHNMVSIGENDDIFKKTTRPVEYFFAIEKSMYQNISQEILNVFATIADFNTLIGDPVNRYRGEYKALQKLRQLFFERVENEPDLDRYIEFYKWIDSSLTTFLMQLVPASARFSNSMRTMVESHVLERNKYRTKFPTLDLEIPELSVGIAGINELLEDWETDHHPISGRQDENCPWWKTRAERRGVISSGVPAVDENRSAYLSASLQVLNRQRTTPYKYGVEKATILKGGSNFYDNKIGDYVKNTLPWMDSGATTGLYILSGNIEPYTCSDPPPPNTKRKLKYGVFTADSGMASFPNSYNYTSGKGEMFVPFSIYSASYVNAFSQNLVTALGYNLEITNVDNDSYGVSEGVPMQGPFTDKFVGGNQYRHVDPNLDGTDTPLTRPEAWRLRAGTGVVKIARQPFQRPRAMLYRDMVAKRPLNLQNIKQVNGTDTRYVSGTLQAQIGNYRKSYEIVQAPGRTTNNRAWVRKGPWILNDALDPSHLTASMFVGGMFDTPEIDRGRTGYVMVSRFSSPGGPDTAGDSNGGPGLDRFAAEFSPNNEMNWRNSEVRDPLRKWLLTPHVNQFGFYSGVPDRIASSSVNATNYRGTGSFYQINRNRRRVIKEVSPGTLGTASVYDNYYIQHPIPSTDLRYAWITASYLSTTPVGLGYWPTEFYIPDLYTASIGPVNFVSASAQSYSIPVDFVGMNNLVYSPIMDRYAYAKDGPSGLRVNLDTRQEAASFDYKNILEYKNANITTPPDIDMLNILDLHRNGPYQAPNWKFMRTAQSPTARYLRKNNFIGCTGQRYITPSYMVSPKLVEDTQTTLYYEPAVSKISTPFEIMVGTQGPGAPQCQDPNASSTDVSSEVVVSLGVSLINAYGFANENLTKCAKGVVTIANNDDSGGPDTACLQTDTGYGTMTGMYLYGALDDDSSPVDSFVEAKYQSPVFPAAINQFSRFSRERSLYYNRFWNSNRATRTTRGETKFISHATSQGYSLPQSEWALDANADFTMGPIYVADTPSTAGELQNDYTQCHESTMFTSSWFLSCSAVNVNAGFTPTRNLNFGSVLYNGIFTPLGTPKTAGTYAREFAERAIVRPLTGTYADTGVPNAYTLSAWVRPERVLPPVKPPSLRDDKKYNIVSFLSADHPKPATNVAGQCAVQLFLTGGAPALLNRRIGVRTMVSSAAGGIQIDEGYTDSALMNGWFHILYCYDATAPGDTSVGNDRHKIYVNGELRPLVASSSLPDGLASVFYGQINPSTGAIGSDASYNFNMSTLTGGVNPTPALGEYFINGLFEGSITEVSIFNYSLHTMDATRLPAAMYNGGCPPDLSKITFFQQEAYKPSAWYRVGAFKGPALGPQFLPGSRKLGPGDIPGSSSWNPAEPPPAGPSMTGSRLVNLAAVYWDSEDGLLSKGDGYPVVDYSISAGSATFNMSFHNQMNLANRPCRSGYRVGSAANIHSGPLYNRKHTVDTPFSVTPFGWSLPSSSYPDQTTWPIRNRAVSMDIPELSASINKWISTYPLVSLTSDPDAIAHPLGEIQINGGNALFEANRLSGYEKDGTWVPTPSAPSYDTYGDYSQYMHLKNQDFSIVPEFRISDHMGFYLNDNRGDFLAENNSLFSIPGSTSSAASNVPLNSSDESFYQVFSNSDFLRHFSIIKQDHKGFADPSAITLRCSGLMKFLPYDGFFPSERSLQIASQFSQSYSPFLEYAGLDSSLTDARMRPFMAPFFQPGIIYNTIKSGLAVDYPLYTSSYNVINYASYRYAGGSRLNSNYYALGTQKRYNPPATLFSASWDVRIPFEAAVEPEKYAAGYFIYDAEPHPSSALDVQVRWNGGGDNLYKRMMSNYLAAIPEFFLPEGTFTSLSSKSEKNFANVRAGTNYGMRVKLRRTLNKPRAWRSYTNPEPIITYDVPQDPRNLSGIAKDLKETFTMYSRPSAFGPPVAASDFLGYTPSLTPDNVNVVYFNTDLYPSDSLMGINPSFTPPYYGGESWADIVYTATSSGPVTLDEIFAASTVNLWRIDASPVLNGATGSESSLFGPNEKQAFWAYHALHTETAAPMTGRYANAYAMQLDASINLFGKSGDKWVIEPKFETPHYNFNSDSSIRPLTSASNTLTIPTNGSESVPRGMWHQFGTMETEKGVYLEVDSIPDNWRLIRGSAPADEFTKVSGIDMSVYQASSFKSLSQLVGFEESKKLGNTAESLQVSEAVVAVPFIVVDGEKQFFEIPADTIRSALGSLPEQSEDAARTRAKRAARAAAAGLGDVLDDLLDTEEERTAARVRAAANAASSGASSALDEGEASITTPARSIIDMVKKMKKYVFPPRMDFVHNIGAVRPFAMYIFEFEYEFDQVDLSYIWQNVAPRPRDQKIVQKDVEISHKLFANELMGSFGNGDNDPIRDGLRWMVFKVKKRANNNYYSKVRKNTGPITQQHPYSYNWPYDFFSLVEFVKMDAKIGFGKGLKDKGISQEVFEVQEDPSKIAQKRKKMRGGKEEETPQENNPPGRLRK